MKKIITACLMLLGIANVTRAQKGFAIVIDEKSYKEASAEVRDYADAIERTQNLKVYYVVDRWGVPDSIRSELQRLYNVKKNPIEGAVFIGDIPVAMVRDGQHMTSAFKMNQKYDRKDSSIPSDRFYDDFDLKFDYIDRDDDAPYYYYSLKACSAQSLQPEIYTGRIRPTDAGGTSRYDKLRAYLKKAVAEKLKTNTIDQILYFGGHGYISESMTARIDEKQGLYEHFPWLKAQRNGIGFIDHTQDKNVKFKLMNELMRGNLDFALLHHHGAWDTQYMNGIPGPDGPTSAKEYIQSYGRSHIRSAREKGKDTQEMIDKLCKTFDVPESWFADTFTPESIEKDSVENDNLDLYIKDFDIYGYKPECRVVMIDACFCGSFHRDDCIANRYIFSEGHTVACIANTVNVLQDKWSDKFIGLLGLGMNVGQISRFSHYLESHTIGDPTFRFTSADSKVDVQHLLAEDKVSVWKKLLKKSRYPELKCLAMEELVNKNEITSAQLLDIFRNSDEALVRMQALVQLSRFCNDDFLTAVQLAGDDSYELVQRYAVRYMGKSGDERLIPALIRLSISNNTSERTNFNAMGALSFFPEDKLLAEFDRQFDDPGVHYIDKAEVREMIRRTIISSADKWVGNCDEIVSPDTKDKTRKSNIRTLRNYCPHHKIPVLLDYLDVCADDDKVMLLEALGWHNYSCNKHMVMEKAEQMSKDESLSEEVRNEALKTVNRLK